MSSFLTRSQAGSLALPGTAGSGDLVALLMQCATNRGARAPANPLPSIQASWTHHSRDVQDIILVTGDHFAELKKALEQAYGAPDPKLFPFEVPPAGNQRILTYPPQQCGVVLSVTGDSKQTIVTVMGGVPVMGKDNPIQPSKEELQEAAKHVWLKLKIFGVLIGIFGICVVAFFSVAAYRSFGIPGLVIVAVIVAIILWLLTRLFLLV